MSQLTEGVKKYEEIKFEIDKKDSILKTIDKVVNGPDKIRYNSEQNNKIDEIKILSQILRKNRDVKSFLISKYVEISKENKEIIKNEWDYRTVKISQLPKLLKLVTDNEYEIVEQPWISTDLRCGTIDNVVYLKEKGLENIDFTKENLGIFDRCYDSGSLDYVYISKDSTNRDFCLTYPIGRQIFISENEHKCIYDERYPLLQPILKAFVMNKDLVLTDEEQKISKSSHKINKEFINLERAFKERAHDKFWEDSEIVNKAFLNLVKVNSKDDVAEQ